MCSTGYSVYLPDKETREKNGEPKVPLTISEDVMISGAALWKERNGI